jgi:hypothetical protein
LGVEVFRDEQGRVLGSTMRGDAVDGAGVHRCQAKSPEEIAGLFAMYAPASRRRGVSGRALLRLSQYRVSSHRRLHDAPTPPGPSRAHCS